MHCTIQKLSPFNPINAHLALMEIDFQSTQDIDRMQTSFTMYKLFYLNNINLLTSKNILKLYRENKIAFHGESLQNNKLYLKYFGFKFNRFD